SPRPADRMQPARRPAADHRDDGVPPGRCAAGLAAYPRDHRGGQADLRRYRLGGPRGGVGRVPAVHRGRAPADRRHSLAPGARGRRARDVGRRARPVEREVSRELDHRSPGSGRDAALQPTALTGTPPVRQPVLRPLPTTRHGGAWSLGRVAGRGHRRFDGNGGELMSQRDLARTGIARHPQTFAQAAGIQRRDKPSPLWRRLVLSLLLSARIDSSIAVRSARELSRAGWRTPAAMTASTWQQRVDALGRGGYRRYDERTATQLGDAAELV